MIYEVLSGKATLWRAVRGRFRVGALGTRSLLVSDGWVSACGVVASPTSSRRNLNLDKKSCQTTYQPNSMKSSAQTSVATMTSSVSPTLCHILTATTTTTTAASGGDSGVFFCLTPYTRCSSVRKLSETRGTEKQTAAHRKLTPACLLACG